MGAGQLEANRLSVHKVKVTINSECEMLREMGNQLGELDWRSALKPIPTSPVCASAFQCIRHVACPIPIAILKATEVEVGMALPKDTNICFETTDKE